MKQLRYCRLTKWTQGSASWTRHRHETSPHLVASIASELPMMIRSKTAVSALVPPYKIPNSKGFAGCSGFCGVGRSICLAGLNHFRAQTLRLMFITKLAHQLVTDIMEGTRFSLDRPENAGSASTTRHSPLKPRREMQSAPPSGLARHRACFDRLDLKPRGRRYDRHRKNPTAAEHNSWRLSWIDGVGTSPICKPSV
jgi:hypothetical protein